MIDVIAIENFPKFQYNVYTSPDTDLGVNRKPKSRDINYNVRARNKIINKLNNFKVKTDYQQKRLNELIEKFNYCNKCCTTFEDRYASYEYCVEHDRAFLFEQMGILCTSRKYQVTYSIEGLLVEILQLFLGTNKDIIKSNLMTKLEKDKIDYEYYCRLLIGDLSDKEDSNVNISYLFNIDTFLDSYIRDLKNDVSRKNLIMHGEEWQNYSEEEQDEVLIKALKFTIWDFEQFIVDEMITRVKIFIKSNPDKGLRITSFGKGGFVLQSDYVLEFPVFELIDINEQLICKVKPRVTTCDNFIQSYVLEDNPT